MWDLETIKAINQPKPWYDEHIKEYHFNQLKRKVNLANERLFRVKH